MGSLWKVVVIGLLVMLSGCFGREVVREQPIVQNQPTVIERERVIEQPTVRERTVVVPY